MEKGNLQKIVIVTFIFSFIMISLCANGQVVTKDSVVLYDDWPVTLPANADIEKYKEGQINPLYVLIGSKWDKPLLTYFFQNHSIDISTIAQRNAVREAFDIWAEQTGLAFLEVCNAANADIVLLWTFGNHGDGRPFDNQGGILAHASPPPPLGGTSAGDVHFDEAEDWTDQISTPGSDIDLVTVAAHEIGHSLSIACKMAILYLPPPYKLDLQNG